MLHAALKLDEAMTAIQAARNAGRISASAVENIRTWLTQRPYAEYVPLILEHIANGQWRELDDAFWTVIPFGTAGRRGRMYPIGTNAVNDRTIGESAQGLADYVLSVVRGQWSVDDGGISNPTDNGLLTTDKKCAIAYDTRHQSRHFAELCAEIMVGNGFDVLFFDGFRPTPELSFTVRDQRCACGIMISASHNPPADNAIKVFWSSGVQLRPPHDTGVIECLRKVTDIRRTPFAEAVAAGRVRFCQDEQDARYRAAVLAVSANLLPSEPGCLQSGLPRDLGILYSPLHGVGLTSVPPILQADGFIHIEIYEPHATPDGDFPNVPDHVANPENPAVFDVLIEHARHRGADLILASDPDADRIGCAAPVSYRPAITYASSVIPHSPLPIYPWQTLTGNQIGVLLAELLLRRLQKIGKLTPRHYVIKTLVTSDMVCRVAERFGIRAFGNVLTGFKWIGSLIDEIGPEKFVFGFEEAHGYLAGTYARDKDGAVAAMLLAELAAECKATGRTLHEQLDQLFLQYGCYLEKTVSLTMPGADGLARMTAMMQRLRTSPPQQLGGLAVRQVRDYLRPIDDVPPSDLLIFDLEPPGNRAAVRPSGTEPKIKFYLFASEPPERSTDLPATKRQLQERLSDLERDLLSLAR